MNTLLFKTLKRIMFLLVIAVLVVGVVAAQLNHAEAADKSIVRIKLTIGTTTSFSFSLNGNYAIGGRPELKLASGSYTVKLQSGTLNLYRSNTLICSGSSIRIVELMPPAGTVNTASIKTTRYGTNNYRGDVEFRISSGSIIAINHIYLEYYLYGVVPHEMSNSWPLEALKAQAVTARTYAVRNMSSGTYDMGDTSSYQVYKGYNASLSNAIKAVDDTAKQVLKSGNELVQTFYAASNGGYVDISQHVWSASVALKPYHIIKEDPYDTANAWSPQEVLIFPKDMTGSSKVRYQYMSSGKMVDGSSTYSSNAERFIKLSSLPAVAKEGYIANVSGDIEIQSIDRMVAHTYVGNHGLKDYAGENKCICFKNADITMTVLANRHATPEEEMETGSALVNEPVTVTFTINLDRFDESGGTYQSFTNTSLRLFVVEETGSSWNIYHRRYGHGVGMSQRGAQTQAREGRTYQQILTFYYPGTSIEALDISPPISPPTDTQTGNATIVNCTNYVNVRSTPSTAYSAIGKAFAGSRITVTQPFVDPEWHKIDFGGIDAYISAYYVQIDDGEPAEPGEPTPTETEDPNPTEPGEPSPTPTPDPTTPPQITQTGRVTASSLNIRSGAGTSHSVVGKLKKDQIVQVIQAFAAEKWHKIWYNNQECYVSAGYVKLDNEIEASGVVTASVLNVRSGAGTSSATVGSFNKGAKVEIIKCNDSPNWHKILFNGAAAYVHADYIRIKQGDEIEASGVVTASVLNVRSGAGTSSASIGSLKKGAKVEIIKCNDSPNWHKIRYNGAAAYAHADYISIGGASDGSGSGGSSEPQMVFATVNANRVNFRQTASLSSRIINTLSRGETVQVLEQGKEWHKIKYGGTEGYMYAQYLDISSAVYGAVTANTLNVRSSASTSSSILGRLHSNDVVEIIQKGSTWHKIRYKSGTAYVYASYIKLQ